MNDQTAYIWAEMLYRLAMTFDLVQTDWNKLPYGQRDDWTTVMRQVAETIKSEERLLVLVK